ncbi:MAG: hypothetical protein AAGB34_10745 [Planctomycetota bacterium]
MKCFLSHIKVRFGILCPALVYVCGVLIAATSDAQQFGWDESGQGDLSNNRLEPSAFTLETNGSTTLRGMVGDGDIDYFTFEVAEGSEWTSLVVNAFSGGDQLAFFGLQSGPVFTEPNDITAINIGNLLGYTLYGPGNGTVGTDILDDVGKGALSQGFSGSLAAGEYTVWLRQGGPEMSYEFTFVTIPSPSCAGLAFGFLPMFSRRRRSVG